MTMHGQTNKRLRIKLNKTTLISTEIDCAATVRIFKACHQKYYLVYHKSLMQTTQKKMNSL